MPTPCGGHGKLTSGLTLAVGSVLGSALLALLAIPVLASGFLPLIRDGWRDLRGKRKINYGLFVAMVTLGGIAGGYVVLIGVFEVVYFGSEVLLVKTRRRARHSLRSMFVDWPAIAWVRDPKSGSEKSVPLVDIAAGDIVVVRAGELIPIDGIVSGGAGGVDQSLVTGESVVAERTIGDQVFASTLLLNGTLEVRVEQAGEDTLAGQIADVLGRMESFEASVEHQSVRLADASVNPTIALGAIGWVARGPFGALTVAASNFADANRLASPLSMYNYLIAMAEAGIHVKDGRSLELLGDVDTVIFDKTGTLTFDRLNVIHVLTVDSLDEHEVLGLAAAAEERQQHPIAEAIRETAAALELYVPRGVAETNSVGNGIAAHVADSRVLVGSSRYMQHERVPIPFEAQAEEEAAQVVGQTVVHVARDQQWIGQISMKSSVRPEVAAMISKFRVAGYQTAILSGDHAGPTRRFAESLGVDGWRAGVLPHEKCRFIERLQDGGHSVCFVGDGINDGMALKAANVSVTLTGASLVATDAAQIILKEGSLAKLHLLFGLSKRFRSDQQMMRGITITNSAVSAGAALILGLSLPAVYALYFATLATDGLVALSPRWRGTQAFDVSPLCSVPGDALEPING